MLEARAFVEGLEGMMFHERDTVNLDVVDLGSELDALVLLAAHYRTDIRAIDAYDAVLHLLPVEVVSLLTEYLSDCQDAFMLFGVLLVFPKKVTKNLLLLEK